MLIRKLLRTFLKYKAQFISMIIMIVLGVGVFAGFNSEWYSIDRNCSNFFDESNLADYRVFLTDDMKSNHVGFTDEDLNKVLSINGVKSASRVVEINTTESKENETIKMCVTSNNSVTSPFVVSGNSYDPSSINGLWLSENYAIRNNYKIGDEGISFDSDVALDLLSKCDVVITNPPFSICRQRFLPMLMESGKQFLFIENINLIKMSTVFPYIKAGRLWTGYTHPKEFLQPDGTYKKFGNILWYTNMPVNKKFEFNFTKTYKGNEDKYPKYDNYDAINVDKLSDIPCDYDGVMGVPITFLDKYNVAGGGLQIVKFRKGDDGKDVRVAGKDKYTRVLVRHRNP